MNRHSRITLGALLAAAALAAACASLTVRSFSARSASFDRYRSYRWADAAPRATGDPRLDNNPFFEQRLIDDADRELAARGFEKRTSGTTDLILHYHASVGQKIDVAIADQRYANCQGCGTGSVYDAGTILLDLVDPVTNTLVWRGWAEGSLDGIIDNQRWLEQRVDEAVRRIVATVPHQR
jgi:hypothetical protein